jgi:hypothetical protein
VPVSAAEIKAESPTQLVELPVTTEVGRAFTTTEIAELVLKHPLAFLTLRIAL